VLADIAAGCGAAGRGTIGATLAATLDLQPLARVSAGAADVARAGLVVVTLFITIAAASDSVVLTAAFEAQVRGAGIVIIALHVAGTGRLCAIGGVFRGGIQHAAVTGRGVSFTVSIGWLSCVERGRAIDHLAHAARL
jgi:hypothetical protein